MLRYAVIVVGPLVIGTLIAIGVLVISGMRERRQRARTELDEARRAQRAASIDRAARSARDLANRRKAS